MASSWRWQWRCGRIVLPLAVGLALAGCSLLSLDGFSGGSTAAADSGAEEAAPPPDAPPPIDSALVDAALDAGDAGPGAYALAVLDDGPRAYFRLADAPGTTVLRNEIAGSTLTMVASAAGNRLGVGGIAGSPGTALALDTNDARVVVGGLELAGTPELFTIEAWIRVDAPGDGLVFQDMDNPGVTASRNGTWLLFDGNRNAFFSEMWLPGSHKLFTSQADAIVLGTFAHVVFIHTDRDHLHVNGAEVSGGILNDGGARISTAAAFQFGGFIGRLDEVAIYGQALPPARIVAHYAAGLQP